MGLICHGCGKDLYASHDWEDHRCGSDPFKIGELVSWAGGTTENDETVFTEGRKKVKRIVEILPDGTLVLGSRWFWGRSLEPGIYAGNVRRAYESSYRRRGYGRS